MMPRTSCSERSKETLAAIKKSRVEPLYFYPTIAKHWLARMLVDRYS
jgi:hypothetical protein